MQVASSPTDSGTAASTPAEAVAAVAAAIASDEEECDHDKVSPSGVLVDGKWLKTTKAYDSREFLHSRQARPLRIVCEYLETQSRLRREGVLFSILFFGSAGALSHEDWAANHKALQEKLAALPADSSERGAVAAEVERQERKRWICDYYDKARELARKITVWAESGEANEALERIATSMPSPVTSEIKEHFAGKGGRTPLVVCTGGGPGLMEAANRGVAECGGRSLGMGVTLPAEPGLNRYVTPELGFQYHYFFTRKFWMVYIALALIALPGGFGTLDELMEVLTLKQTNKIKRDMPIVLLGKQFWKKAVGFDFLVESGTISASDLAAVLYTDDVDEAFQFVRSAVLHDKLIAKR